MKYKKIVNGKFIERPNRFIARVAVDGEECTAHVKNTGRCRELLVPGCTVYLEDFEGRMGSRKHRYSLIAVIKEPVSDGGQPAVGQRNQEDGQPAVGQRMPDGEQATGNTEAGLLINMDSQAPNKVVREALESGAISLEEMGRLTVIRAEVAYGDSRFDFYVEDEDGRCGFIEVKGCTLENKGICSFPDAPTLRGVKHIEGLMEARRKGYCAAVIFAVQMSGMKYMVPNDSTHPEFGAALRKADREGVQVLAYECRVGEDSLEIDKALPVRL